MMSQKELSDLKEEYNLTKSQKKVLDLLLKYGKNGITPKEILDEVDFAPRTVRYALRSLLKKDLVHRVPHLLDMRQHIYAPADQLL